MTSKLWSTVACSLLLAGCTTGSQIPYGPPEDSGLIGVNPFPGADDVCQVIGENDLSSNYLDDRSILIGCPVAEAGAIADRVADGATEVGEVGDWVLLSVPN